MDNPGSNTRVSFASTTALDPSDVSTYLAALPPLTNVQRQA